MKDQWYTPTKPGDYQGLTYNEKTGQDIAVTYNPEHASLVAAAPYLLDALPDIEGMCNMPEVKQAMMKHEQAYYHRVMNAVRKAISKAEG